MINADSTVIVIHPMQDLLDLVSQLLFTYHAMAHTGPTLSSSGTVQIRFISLDLGTTKWREGTFEIVEKDNKASLCLRFNCGTLKFFQVLCFCSPDLFIRFIHLSSVHKSKHLFIYHLFIHVPWFIIN